MFGTHDPWGILKSQPTYWQSLFYPLQLICCVQNVLSCDNIAKLAKKREYSHIVAKQEKISKISCFEIREG